MDRAIDHLGARGNERESPATVESGLPDRLMHSVEAVDADEPS